MRSIRPIDPSRPCNIFGHSIGSLVNRIEILCSDQDQGSYADLREPIKRGWMGLLFLGVIPFGRELERQSLHFSNQLADFLVHSVGATSRPIDPATNIRLQRLLQITCGQGGSFAVEKRLQVFSGPGNEGSPWRDEHHGRDLRGSAERNLNSYARAEGRPHKVAPRNVKEAQRLEHVVRRAEQPLWALRGLTKTTKVQADDIM
ncbi:hypothetical protein BH10ACT8_BH10ACT8_23820 [soil metagenome]